MNRALNSIAASLLAIATTVAQAAEPSDKNSYRPAHEEIKKFNLPDGFEIELVASEPLIINPVCLTLDEQGRMYVSESHTYRYGENRSPVAEPTNPIVRLDPLPQGKGFRRVVVAEGFTDPVMGMAIRGEKLWCTANDQLFTFDLTDEGPAKNKQLLLVDKNKAWNPFGMFVLEWDSVGDLLLSVGNHNIDIGPPDQPGGEGISGRGNSGIVMRMKPDGTQLERLTHGLRVPYAFDYDPFGQLWLLSNGQGNPNRFVRVIQGVDYHCYSRREVDHRWLAGDHPLAPPCEELPPGACTQLLRYYGAAFPASYQGSLFLDNWGAHGFGAANRTIHRYVPDARNNIVAKEDFLTCDDPHFRCSHLLYAPDGNLLIADWYGRDDESDLTGRIWKVSYTGADQPKVAHTLESTEWNELPAVISALGSVDHRVRNKAMDTLARDYRGAKALPIIAQAAADESPLAAAGELWTLARIGTPDALSQLKTGTQHDDWRVRRLSLNLLERYDVAGREQVAQATLKTESDPAVHLAAALNFNDSQQRREALLNALSSGAAADRHLRYEAAWHLAEVADRTALAQLLESDDQNLRLAGLIAIDVAIYEQRSSHEAAIALLAQQLAAPGKTDAHLLLDLARLHRLPQLAAALRKLIADPQTKPATLAEALLTLQSFADEQTDSLDRESVRRFLAAVESGAAEIRSTEDALTLLALLEMEGPTPFALAEIGRRSNDRQAGIRDAALQLAENFGADAAPLADQFWAIILDEKSKLPPHRKLDYLRVLLAIEAAPNQQNWNQILQHGDPLLVTDALRSWRKFAGDPAMMNTLYESAAELSKRQPALKGDLAAVLADDTHGVELARKLSLPAQPSDDEPYLRAAASVKPSPQKVALGRRVFERTGCVACHSTVLESTARAPSLKGLGKSQKIDYLIESVLRPSQVIKTGFETETVVTTDGKIFTGLVEEQDENLHIISADTEVLLEKTKVDQRSVNAKSLMPESQHRQLSPREFADLIAYLQKL